MILAPLFTLKFLNELAANGSELQMLVSACHATCDAAERGFPPGSGSAFCYIFAVIHFTLRFLESWQSRSGREMNAPRLEGGA